MRVHTRFLGVRDYLPVWRDMQRFTDSRTGNTEDEIWLLEHYPVFTLGQAGRIEHLLEPGTIPVIHADRGGQVTYHGPGQLIAYLLVDLRRRRIGEVDGEMRGVIPEAEKYNRRLRRKFTARR